MAENLKSYFRSEEQLKPWAQTLREGVVVKRDELKDK